MNVEQRLARLESLAENLEEKIENIYEDVRYAYNIAAGTQWHLELDEKNTLKKAKNYTQFIKENLHMMQQSLAIAIIALQDVHKQVQRKVLAVTTLEIPPLCLVPNHKSKT